MNVRYLNGGTWADVTRRGQVVISYRDHIEIEIASIGSPEWLLFLRADVNDAGEICVIGKGFMTGNAWTWRALTGWIDLGPTVGNYPVEVAPWMGGWRLWVQRTTRDYELREYDAQDHETSIWSNTFPDSSGTSQGFLDGTRKALLFTDQARRIGDTVKPVDCGPYLVGQHPTEEWVILSDYTGTPLRILAKGWFDSPRAAWIDGHIVMASITSKDRACVVKGGIEDFQIIPPLTSIPPPSPEPNPVPTYTPIAPNRFTVVEAVHREDPSLIHSPHKFTAKVACRLWKEDPRWGHNGKRGNPNDLSEDAICYMNSTGPGGVEIFDIIGGANTPNATPTWQNVTQQTIDKGTVGVWTKPVCDGVSPPPVTPPPPSIPELKSYSQFAAEIAEVNAFYEASEGLKRPGGMVIDRGGPSCDIEGVAIWSYRLLADNATLNEVLEQIRQSDEWRQKHYKSDSQK